MRLIKCNGHCGEKYKKDDLIQVGSKNFCNECYKKYEEEKALKKANKKYKCQGSCGGSYKLDEMVVRSGKKYCKSCNEKMIKNMEDFKILNKTICRLYGYDFVPPGIRKQVNNYMQEFNYTILGINETLLYIESHRKNVKFEQGYGIGIVCYYYAAAMKNKAEKEKKFFESINIKINNESDVVVTSKQEAVNELKKQKLISMEDVI